MIVCSILITIGLNVSDLDAVNCSFLPIHPNSTYVPLIEQKEGTNAASGIFAIIATLTFVVFFALGPGSIPWLITGELFTQGTRL